MSYAWGKSTKRRIGNSIRPLSFISNISIFREDTKVSHYIINKIQEKSIDQILYRIGDQSFNDLPELLAFYKLHYLDTTPLRRPAPRKLECVIGKFDFDGSVSELHNGMMKELWISELPYRTKMICPLKRAKSCTLFQEMKVSNMIWTFV